MMTPDFVFLDTETTGANPCRDRIIEVGLYLIVAGKKERVWNHLLNPDIAIPAFITRLTSIDNEMVQDVPRFNEIANELAELLHGRIMVAHNARFDYAFLKNEFKRCDIDFREKTLCTVKLSRQVYALENKHSLDAIKSRFNLKADGRHRALADVELMYQFFQIVQNQFSSAGFQEIVHKLVKNPSLPIQVAPELIENIPNTAGIYKFYDENQHLIYIGKSVSLRDRVLSHFSADYSTYKEMRLAQQVKHIEWVETQGEFGALLMEALLVKAEMPVHNRRLRKHRDLFTFALKQNAAGYAGLSIVPFQDMDEAQASIYGLFRTKQEAENKLQTLAVTHQLCHKLLGLERAKGSCFQYQLKKCLGACIEKEPLVLYNLRIKTALAGLAHQAWPFKGKIALVETCTKTERVAFHVFDRWRYLGTKYTESDLAEISNRDACFDIDVYKLLQKNLPLFQKRKAILLFEAFEPDLF